MADLDATPMADDVMLYDGTCGFCAASVAFILRHEQRKSLRFAPLQGAFAAGVRGRHPELEGVDSMVWVEAPGTEREQVAVRGRAVLRAAGYLGRIWALAGIARVLPSGLLDAGYDLVARHRHKLVREPDACFIPSPDVRARFLD